MGVLAATTLLVSMAQPVTAAPRTAPVTAPAAPSKAAGEPLSRPDGVAARVTALSSGERVEVEGLRDEFSSTFVNPDGSWTTQAHAGQQRFGDGRGGWRQVDLALERAGDGSVRAKGHPGGLRLSGGGAGVGGVDLVTVDEPAAPGAAGAAGEARQVSLAWGGRLPAPVLDGERATYEDVTAGVDMVVASRRSGFEQLFVLNDPSVVAAAPAGGLSWSFTARTKGLTARAEVDGSISFVDSTGKVASRIPAAIAWDAQVDPASGEPASPSPVALEVTQRGKGLATITVRPDRAWLADPARVFPITVDPTYASATNTATFDTFTQSNIANTDQSGGTELKVGTYDGGATKARSYLEFLLGPFQGKTIISAYMSLHEVHSYSCTPSPVTIYGLTAGATTATRWSNQPGLNGTYGSLSAAKGYSGSCPAGRINIPATDLAKKWATSTGTAGTIALVANESDSNGWKRFASLETTSDPYISFTYNRAPAAPAMPSIDGSGVHGDPAKNQQVAYTHRLDPHARTTGVDPDGNAVKYTYEVHSSTTTSSTTLKAWCTTPLTASGTATSCPVQPALGNNFQSWVRAKTTDELGAVSGWSPWRAMRTAATAPGVSVTCGRANGSWTDQPPAADVSCTATTSGTSYSGISKMTITVDGQPVVTPALNYAPQSAPFTVPRAEGGHTIAVSTKSASNLLSPTATYSFGYGGASLGAPLGGEASNGKFKVTAAGPPRGTATAVSATLQWRRAGSGDETTGWNTGTVSPTPAVVNGTGGTGTAPVSTTFVWDANTATIDKSADTTANKTDEAKWVKLPTRTPARLDVQVCFTYTGITTAQCTWSQPTNGKPASIVRMPHAFGNGFPVAEAGPGQVALWTGEFNTSTTDVTVPAYTGTLSLSRSHSTYDGPDALTQWPTLPGSGVLGPGWTLGLDGSDIGDAALQVVDNTLLDGTISFVDSDGTALVFAPPKGLRRTGATLESGDWVPVDEDTAAAGVVLSVKDTASIVSGVATAVEGGGLDLLLRDVDGTVTTYLAQTAPAVGAAGTFTPGLVDEPGGVLSTTYSRDSAGRTTRILAPTPPEVTCAATGALPAGCRALTLTYATTDTTDTGTGRDVTGQLKSVAYNAYNPAKTGGPGMDTLTLATYAYDSSKRLTRVHDTRSNLTTVYTYDGTTPRIKTMTAPGLAPFTLNYATNITSGLPVQLASVNRGNPDASTGSVRVNSFVYGIDPTTQGAAAGLPALAAGDVEDWQQQGVPTYGAAVFTGATNPGTHNGANVAAGVWKDADLQYTTVDGYTVNTASYGAGDWQITAQDYDTHGNVIRSLDAGGITAHKLDAAANAGTSTLGQVLADPYASLTQYNPEEKLTTALTLTDGTVLPVGHVIAAAGTKVLHEWGPEREAVIDTANGPALARVRPHTRSVLDEGAPNNGLDPNSHQRYNLVTTTIDGAADPTTATTVPGQAVPADVDVDTVTRNTYDALETTNTSGPTSGWMHGAPTRTREILNPTGTGPGYGANDSTDIIRDAVLDSEGRTVQTRQPSESGGTTLPAAGPGTMLTRYYTANDQTAPTGDTACGKKPEWAGLTCTFGPAAAAGAIPTTRTSDFTWFLAPRTLMETTATAAVTRSTTTNFDAADRPTSVTTTLTGITTAASEPVPATTTSYSTTTGLPTTVSDSTGTITTGYDAWGRATTYTSTGSNGAGAPGGTTTTSYDPDGRVASVTDPKGTTTYTYNGTDALGRDERRGMATRVAVSTAAAGGAPGTGPVVEFTGAYDADGALTTQTLPGGLVMTDTYDGAGEPLGRVYTGPDGPDEGTERDPWLGWSQTNDVTGRVVAEYTPNAAVFDPAGAVADPDGDGAGIGATQYHRQYTYDGAGRLINVADRTADPNTPGINLEDPNQVTALAGCTTRAYTFNRNGARTNLTTRAAAANQTCPAATDPATSTRTWTVDGADRTTAATRTTAGTTTNGSYVFDALGRVTTLPGVDTLTGTNATLAYRANDSAWKISTGTTTQQHTYDTAGRRVQATSTDTAKPAGQQTTRTLTRTYTDTSDNPSWTTLTDPDTTGGTKTTTTRYLPGLAGGLAATATETAQLTGTTATVQVMLPNLHGDITATTTLPSTGTSLDSAVGIDSWNDTDEYGNPRTTNTGPTPAGGVTPASYGWHGTAERSTDTPAGLTLMGARLYNPTTGLFTSTDPVYGGNDTTYAYPSDPVNSSDLDGERRKKKEKKSYGYARGKYIRPWPTTSLSVYKRVLRYTYRHTVLSFSFCAGICGGASFQGGKFSLYGGAVGLMAKGPGVGWASRPHARRSRYAEGAGAAWGPGGYATVGSGGRRRWTRRDAEIGFAPGFGGWIGRNQTFKSWEPLPRWD